VCREWGWWQAELGGESSGFFQDISHNTDVFALKLSLKTSPLLRLPPHVFLFKLLGIFLKVSSASELKASSACNMFSFFKKKENFYRPFWGPPFLAETI